LRLSGEEEIYPGIYGHTIMTLISVDIEGRGRAAFQLDDRNPGLAQALLRVLPISTPAERWQEEIYFSLPFACEDENPSISAQRGDVSYWSPGPAFCIFFGDSQPISAVNHLGSIVEGLDAVARARQGDVITLSVAP